MMFMLKIIMQCTVGLSYLRIINARSQVTSDYWRSWGMPWTSAERSNKLLDTNTNHGLFT